MTLPSTRIPLMLAAFLSSLALMLGGILWLTRDIRPAGIVQQGTVGGPFQLTDQDGQTITADTFRGKPFLMFFARQGRRPRRRAVRQRRSGARHA
jgi:protein SCO1/2